MGITHLKTKCKCLCEHEHIFVIRKRYINAKTMVATYNLIMINLLVSDEKIYTNDRETGTFNDESGRELENN